MTTVYDEFTSAKDDLQRLLAEKEAENARLRLQLQGKKGDAKADPRGSTGIPVLASNRRLIDGQGEKIRSSIKSLDAKAATANERRRLRKEAAQAERKKKVSEAREEEGDDEGSDSSDDSEVARASRTRNYNVHKQLDEFWKTELERFDTVFHEYIEDVAKYSRPGPGEKVKKAAAEAAPEASQAVEE